MTLVTVDLDNTLIETGRYYTDSMEEFGELLRLHEGVDPETAIETLNKIDSELVEEYGVQKDRFPQSFRLATEELVDDPSNRVLRLAEEIGYGTFKEEAHYRVQGWMDGSEEMVQRLHNDHATDLHLVTVGDPEVQQPKIDALELEPWFDDIHVCTHSDGKQSVFEQLLSETPHEPHEFFHIGDSATSDIEPAVGCGGNAVYISDRPDWLSSEEDHMNIKEHKRVTHFDSPKSFTERMDEVLHQA